MRDILVAVQAALACAALVTAALFVRSLLAAQRTDLGFDLTPQVVTTFDLAPLKLAPERLQQFFDDARARLRAIPSVIDVAITDTPPLAGSFRRTTFPAGVDLDDPSNGRLTGVISVTPNFFATTGMRLRRGRYFEERDNAGSAMVAVINETAGRALWPREDPIGKRMRFLLQDWDVSVVGVVNTVTIARVGEEAQPVVYFPLKQHPSSQGSIYTRTAGDPETLANTVRSTIVSLEPGLENARVRSGRFIAGQALAARRVGAQFLSAFGALALMLAVLGTYSVVACVVDQRRRDMAIRVALGAAPSDIASAVLTRSLASVAVGIAAGLVVAAMVGGAAGSMLYGVGVLDPVSFAASAALLFAVALAGCTIPVWRATRVDPISVLRTD